MTRMSLIEPGKKAPAFALKDQHGETHRLSRLCRPAGRALLLSRRTTRRAAPRRPASSRRGCRRSRRRRPSCSASASSTRRARRSSPSKHGITFPLLADAGPRGGREIRRLAGEVALRPQVHGHRPHDVSHRPRRQGGAALGQGEGGRPRRGSSGRGRERLTSPVRLAAGAFA